LFFDEQTPDSLIGAIRSFEDMHLKPNLCRANAARFDVEVFRRELAGFVEKRYDERQLKAAGRAHI
jgi:hypothetical protein